MWNTVKRLLDARHMTIYQLSVKTGTLNSRAIYDFAAGRVKNPSFRTMEKIADALDVSMDEFRENNPDIEKVTDDDQ